MAYGERSSSAALRGWVGLVSFLQLGTALAVILITYFKLSHISNFSVDAGARTYNVTGTCLLNADTSKADMWAVGAVVIMKRAWAADDANVGNHNWRLAEWIICWVGCALFLLLALLSFARMIADLCACCGGGNKRYP